MPFFLKILAITFSVSWMLVYVLALRRGCKDKTYGIPLAAVLANVAWELLYSTVFRDASPVGPQVAAIWLVLDGLILVQIFWHWRREFPSMGPVLFALLVCAGLCFCVAALFYAETERVEYISSAFPQNLMMSILFIPMFYARDDARGQSLYIALFKLLGTGAAIVQALLPLAAPAGLYATTFCGILFFDLLYVFLLYAKLRRLGIPPWRRL